MKKMKDVNKILEQMAKENMEAERREKFEERLNEEIAELQSKYDTELLSQKSKFDTELLSLKSKYDAEIVKSAISLLEDPQLPAINTPSKVLDALAITGERRKEILEALKERGYVI